MEVVKKEEVSEETEAEEAASEVEIDKKSTRKRKSRSGGSSTKKSSVKLKAEAASEPIVKLENDDEESDARFIGEPVSAEEARKRWPKKYEAKVLSCFFDNVVMFSFFLDCAFTNWEYCKGKLF